MPGNISLELILHNEVQQLLDNFASVMRVHVVFFGPDGEVLRQGRSEGNCRFCQYMQKYFTLERCLRLDKEKQLLARKTGKCQSYLCHAGLWEAVIAVMPAGELLGYVMFGQFRSTEKLPENIRKLAPSKKELAEVEKAFRDLPYLSPDGMDNLTGLMKMLVGYIVRNELVTRGGDYLFRALNRYLEENLSRNVTIADAARHLGRSVSTLSHFLQKNSETSFKKLLIEKRLKRAEKLLAEHPEMSIAESADAVGIRDPYYFSRIYKKYRGKTPGDFRRKRS